MSKLWTAVELIDATKTFFEKKGIDTARLDAELLLAEVLGCPRIQLYVQFDRAVGEPELTRFRELVRLRGERRPVKQLLGRCEFMSHEFEVTADVLVPRPETETLVEHALAGLDDARRSVADLGTGSGNIAVAIALARPNATVYATDVSEPALAVARRNVARHGLGERVHTLLGDLFEPLPEREFDAVVSNPPYVAESELPGLMPEVAQFEPRVAVVSGDDGMGHIGRIVSGAADYVRAGGRVLIEVSPHTAARAARAAEANDAYAGVELARDPGKAERVLIATKKD